MSKTSVHLLSRRSIDTLRERVASAALDWATVRDDPGLEREARSEIFAALDRLIDHTTRLSEYDTWTSAAYLAEDMDPPHPEMAAAFKHLANDEADRLIQRWHGIDPG